MAMRERRLDAGVVGLGDGLGIVAGLVLAVSSFTGWYSGEGEGVTISVLGWNTGILGKLVLFVGLAVVLVLVLRELGIEPPAALPQSLLTVALGALGTIFVLDPRHLRPGRLLLRRPRGRHLDRARGRDRRDRRGPAPGLRGALG